jgi:RNA polymerase sigma-70 factor (ECF subfamily)
MYARTRLNANRFNQGGGDHKMKILDVYENYYKYIFNYALKLTCHPEDALDLTQDTFLKAMEKLNTLDHKQALANWLRAICFHEFINKAKKEPKKYLLEENDLEKLEQEGDLLNDVHLRPEDEIIVAEEIRGLQNGCFLAMVRKLTLRQRITFSLVDMYGLPIEYVAKLLDVSVGAAKGLLYRARMNIDSFFGDHCNIIHEKNPCACKAWIQFSANRSNLQQQSHNLLKKLDYRKKGYVHNEDVRKKVMFLYRYMPEKKTARRMVSKCFNNVDT